MKNPLIILSSCLIIAGCATGGSGTVSPNTLISFEEIADQITITRTRDTGNSSDETVTVASSVDAR